MGAVRRWLAAIVVLAVVATAVYYFALRETTVEARVAAPELAAAIGSGEDAVGVSAGGAIIRWLPLPEDGTLPQLPLDSSPRDGRLAGPALEQARLLGAAPAALRPHIAGSSYGEDGVEVELDSGIELRFGDAGQAARKWSAAAAVLADPSITALDYVDLHAPSRPAVGGSGHALPPLP